jgi:hypothetical protein
MRSTMDSAPRLRLHGARFREIARGPEEFANILDALGIPAAELLAGR